MRLATIAWRGLIARPLRTALTIAGVALGVAVVSATLITSRSADEAVQGAAAELLGRAELRVRAFRDEGFTPRTVQAVRSLPGVLVAAPVSERRLLVSTAAGPREQVFNLLVIGLEPEAEAKIRDPRVEAGVFLSADSPTDAVVTRGWANDHGLGLGDQLLLSGRVQSAAPLRIVGLIDQSGFGALNQGAVALVSRQTLDTSFQIPAPVSYIDIDIGAARVADVEAALDRAMSEPFVVETRADAAAQLGRAQASFAGISFLFGLVALVVGAFLVGNTLAMTVSERTREIGLLRAAGTTSRQILGLFLRQGAAIGVIGAALGLLLGVALAAAMIGFLGSTRAVLVGGLPLDLGALLLAFGLGVMVTLLGAGVPALRAAGLSPLEALRPLRQTGGALAGQLRWLVLLELAVVIAGLILYPLNRGAAPVIPLILSLALLVGGAVAAAVVLEPLGRVVGQPFEWFFGAEGLLGRANLSRDRVRTGLTIGALMIGLASVVAIGAVAESTRATADRWVGSVLPGGHAIRLGIAVDAEQLRPTFEATNGLQAASPIVEFPAVIAAGTRQEQVSVAGIDPTVFQDSGALLLRSGIRAKAFQALRDGGAVFIPDGLAQREGFQVGDILRVGLPGATPQTFTIAGILSYTLPGRTPEGSLLMSLGDARDQFGEKDSSLWAMVPKAGVSSAAFDTAVRETAASLAGEALTARELASQLSRSLDGLIGLFDALALIAVVVAALGIVNTLSVGVSERVREIAILRSHGMTVGQVQAMVVAEAAIMGAVGGLAAIVTGLAVGWAMLGAAGGSEAGGFAVPWALLAIVILVGTGVAALAGLYPARLAGGLPIVRSLKHFE
jgi:putative ABC transport system permease protein